MEAQAAIDNGEAIERLTALIEGMHQNAIHAYKSDPPHESNFHPISADQLLTKTPEEVEWILEEYLPAGGLVLLVGKPKEGKTTLAYELAVKVAQGASFLGRQTQRGGVLILAVEEHQRDVLLRLRNLNHWSDRVFVHSGPSVPTATVFDSITNFPENMT
jgi:hypothetical protein